MNGCAAFCRPSSSRPKCLHRTVPSPLHRTNEDCAHGPLDKVFWGPIVRISPLSWIWIRCADSLPLLYSSSHSAPITSHSIVHVALPRLTRIRRGAYFSPVLAAKLLFPPAFTHSTASRIRCTLRGIPASFMVCEFRAGQHASLPGCPVRTSAARANLSSARQAV
jgi:hypothetical protein